MKNNEYYIGGSFVTGIIIFIIVWIYTMVQWGFLIGLSIGWFPAIIAGFIGGILWIPLIIGVILVGIFGMLFMW